MAPSSLDISSHKLSIDFRMEVVLLPSTPHGQDTPGGITAWELGQEQLAAFSHRRINVDQ